MKAVASVQSGLHEKVLALSEETRDLANFNKSLKKSL